MKLKLSFALVLLVVLASFGSTAQARSTLKGVTAVSVGDFHTCAIAKQRVYCWGSNGLGALGNGTATSSTVPRQVTGLDKGVRKLGLGGDAGCAATHSALKCWGNFGEARNSVNVPLRIFGVPNPVVSVAVSQPLGSGDRARMCAVAQAELACADLGTTRRSEAVADLGGPAEQPAPGLVDCAVVGGAGKCWGDLADRAQNPGHQQLPVPVPTVVPGLESGVTSISNALSYACAVVSSALKCWGTLPWKGPSSSDPVPVIVPGLESGVRSVSTGTFTTCALLYSGEVKCLGYGRGMVFGADGVRYATAQKVGGLADKVTALSTSDLHACAIDDGKLKCWGFNSYGQLGNGHKGLKASPPREVVAPRKLKYVRKHRPLKAQTEASYSVNRVTAFAKYTIPKNMKTATACGARVSITLSLSGEGFQTGRTRFAPNGGECIAEWIFTLPEGSPLVARVAFESDGNRMVKPFRRSFSVAECHDRFC